ncbi:hypothetical protein DRQ33_08590 [bacterium]|nr:MAG: hypothetical protein DRQ33_08590 [bacterium]
MLNEIKEKLLHIWWLFRIMFKRYFRHSGPMMAAAISFYFLLSSVPLTLLGLSILGMLLESPQRAATLVVTMTNLRELFPAGTMQLTSFFNTFISRAEVVSIMSMALLFILSGGVFLIVESAINRVFERHEDRPLWRQILFAYILMLLTYLALFGSAVTTWGVMIATDIGTTLFGIPNVRMGVFWQWFWLITPVIWVALFFALVYKIIPHRKVPWKYALMGGAFAAILWEFAKRIFTLYIKYVVRFNELYGGISVILATFVWIFYTASILLLGGELVMSIIHQTARGEELL